MLFLASLAYSQTAPIQQGSSNYNGDLYHDGDIGLGTTTPSARIHLIRPFASNMLGNLWSDDYLKVQESGFNGIFNPPVLETKFIINSSGNVGINTGSPSEKLHLNGRLRIQTSFGNATMAAYNADFFHFITDLPRFYFNKQLTINGVISSYQTNDLVFQTNNNNNTRARIEHSTGDFVLEGGDLILKGNISNTLGSNEIKLDASTGQIRAREVKVDLALIPDYVFKEDYNLMPLAEVKAFIEENGHLPNVKSEAEFQKEGSISLTEMNLKLLEKVEELTLYILDLQEQIDELKTK